jgi:hypothetical protein
MRARQKDSLQSKNFAGRTSSMLPCATISPPRGPAPAKIDNVIRRADRLFIMLNHNHGIAEIA